MRDPADTTGQPGDPQRGAAGAAPRHDGASATSRRDDALEHIAARVLTGLALGFGALTVLTWVVSRARGAAPEMEVLVAWRGIAGALLLGFGLLGFCLMRAGHDRLAAGFVLLSCQVAATVHAWGSGLGVHTLAMTSSALALAFSGLLLSLRLTLALATTYALAVLLLFGAERAGVLPGQAASATVTASERLITHGLLAAGGLAVALLVGWLLRRSTERLHSEHERASTLLAIGSDWTWQSDARGTLTDLSDGFERQTGLTRAVGLSLGQPGGVQFLMDRHFEHAHAFHIRGLPYRDIVINYRLPDGGVLSLRSSADPIVGADGRITGWRGTSRNISHELAQQREHEQTQAMLDQIVRVSPDAIAVAGDDGTIRMVNAGFVALAGLPADRIVGRSAAGIGLWSADEQARLAAALQREGVVRGFRTRIRGAEGREREVVISAGSFEQPAGARAGVEGLAVITTRDITDDEHARLQADAIVDSAAVGIALVRRQRFERVNPQWEAMFGHPRGSLLGQPTERVFPDSEAYARFLAQSTPRLAAGRPIDMEREVVHADGTRVRLRLRARALDAARSDDLGTLWLAEDVTERRASERALADAKQAAESASQAKSAFLATMSHEIRTPLNGVLGLAQLLQDEALPAAQRQALLGHLLDSARTLAGLVSDVLDLSKIEAGHLAFEDVVFDPRELVAATFRSFEPLASERGLGLKAEVAPEVPARLRGDPLRVRQILANYLANALKFTAAGQIRAWLTLAAPGRLRLEVADTGTGVPPAIQPLLFRPFVQADGSTTRRFGGTGLGLSICRELAERMGGAVGVHSDGVSGSVFWAELQLPAADDAAQALAGAKAGATTVPEDAGATAAATAAPEPAAGGPAPQHAGALAGRVLLVAEDNVVNLLIVGTLLRRLGARVLEAADGEQAVALALHHAHELDAVLMDLHMPVMDGLAATQQLRHDPATARLPVLAFSAAVLEHERAAARAAGMSGFVAKPVQEGELLQALQSALAPAAAAADASPSAVAVPTPR